MEKLQRTKIGTEYFRAGCGRSKPKKATVWLINGYAYARDKAEGSLTFEGNELVDYDGVMSLPQQLVTYLEAQGYNMEWAKD